MSACEVHVDRHLGSQWEKVTATFRITQIPKHYKSEVKSAMALVSIEPSLPTALDEKMPPQLYKEVIDTVNSEDIQHQEVRCIVFDIGGQEIYYEIKFLFLVMKMSSCWFLMLQNLLKNLWLVGVEDLKRRLLLEECQVLLILLKFCYSMFMFVDIKHQKTFYPLVFPWC